MAYAKPLRTKGFKCWSKRLITWKDLQRVSRKICPTELVTEDEARELKERLGEILTAKETPIDWREVEKDALE